MREDLPSGTVTFLFTDVEGSTKLLHELGAEGYAEALAEHRRVIRDACAAEGGVEVDTQGDAFFFAFPTAPGAIAAAEAMTESLSAGPIQVRIGLHTGEPLLAEEGYVGDDVHFAARVSSSGHGGQVILSAATADVAEVELTDLGEHRLKDIPHAVPIYQLGDGTFPPLKTISNTNLPRPASSFVGRDHELVEVLARLEEGARLLTLTGPGGTGKTRLAIEAASELVPEFKAGVFWVGLATLRDPALVTETIAQTLGAKDGLAEHIGERELMLLLDNLEQVIEVAPELASLVEACPNLRLLGTSRELLRVRGEVEYAVPPLAEQDAVSLFCERAQLAADETIAELCRRLDDLPLAVELAAARTSVLTPEQILERLSQRLDLLKGGRDADPRQQTLRSTIEWSYDLLSSREQQLFARLSVFAGGCTLEAAEAVCDADLDTMQSLVDKSLIRFTDGRYWMLETIREYAEARLEEADFEEPTCRALEVWSLKLAEDARSEAVAGRSARGRNMLLAERENLRGALTSLGARDAAEELELVRLLAGYWVVTGQVREGLRNIERVLARHLNAAPEDRAKLLLLASDCARLQGDPATATSLAEEGLNLARSVLDTEMESEAILRLATSARAAGDYRRAEELYAEAIAAFKLAGTSWAGCVADLADIALAQDDFERALELAGEAVDLAGMDGDEDTIAVAQFNLASALIQLGRIEEAKKHVAISLRTSFERGYAEAVAWGLLAAATVTALSGKLSDAASLLVTAEQSLTDLGLVLGPAEERLRDTVVSYLDSDAATPAIEHRRLAVEEAVSVALAAID